MPKLRFHRYHYSYAFGISFHPRTSMSEDNGQLVFMLIIFELELTFPKGA